MSGFSDAQAAGHPGARRNEFDEWRSSGHRFGLPLPLKILLVVGAFWVFPPLGIAALAYLLWRSAQRNGGCAFRRHEGFLRFAERGGWADRWHRPATRNSAFEERRRETRKQLDDEAQAFEEFVRKQREARDKEAFDRFMAERNAPKGPEEPQ